MCVRILTGLILLRLTVSGELLVRNVCEDMDWTDIAKGNDKW